MVVDVVQVGRGRDTEGYCVYTQYIQSVKCKGKLLFGFKQRNNTI